MFGGNVVLHNAFYIKDNGKLEPQPEPGSQDFVRCQMFPDLFTQVDAADEPAEGASVASEPAVPAPDVAEVAVAEPVTTPSVLSSTGLIESPTVTKRVKSKLGG
jgi:hypothetical protein